MAEAQPTSHVAIFVLMAILLTAVTTTATPHHSPQPAVQVGKVADGAREGTESHHHKVEGTESHHDKVEGTESHHDKVEGTESLHHNVEGTESHHHNVESHQAADVAIEDDVKRGAESHHTANKTLPEPQRSEVEALKKKFNCNGRGYTNVRAFLEIKTDSRHRAGTDADVQVSVEGPNGISATNFIDDPDADDFESGSQKYYGVCLHDLGDKIIKVHVRLTERGDYDDWFLDWIRVYYKGECYKFVFWKWMENYHQWYVEDDPIDCF